MLNLLIYALATFGAAVIVVEVVACAIAVSSNLVEED
jgi:hypothetical protein